MMKHWILGMSALALVIMGCAHGEASPAMAPAAQPEAQSHATSGAGMAGGRMTMCPMAVTGTQVSAADTSTGETLAFTTTSPDQVAELRTRVRAMAEMHNQHPASGGMHEGMHEHGGMMGGGGAMANMPMPPPSTATVEDTDAGARLILTPTDPAQMAQLQSAVRSHAEMMQQGGCGMMQGMQQPGATPPGH